MDSYSNDLYGIDIIEDMLAHYGIKRRSGRYPWGSGDNPYQHSADFLARAEQLKKEKFTYTDENGKVYSGEVAIAKSFGLTTTQYRAAMSIAKAERRNQKVAQAKALKEKGYSNTEIGKQMGLNESSVRSLLDSDSEARMNEAMNTAEFIKKQIDEKGMIDVGVGVERELGVSKEKLRQALDILEMEGYEVYGVGVPQVTNNGKQTNTKVICPPGTEYKDTYDYANIHSLEEYYSHDDGKTFDKYVYPASMDSSRVDIRYAEQGGTNMDGVIEIRPGVEDLSLGNSHYAQVRILVDGDRYLKGMAVYSDDLPEGVDIRFNTNKHEGTPKRDVLKKIKSDPNNPFGALIKPDGQSYYIDADGNRKLSLVNKTREEGDWNAWSDSLSAQFLSKQSESLISRQLNLTITDKMTEFDEINNLTNPTIKKALLESFASDCDSAAVHLKAAALPRQKYQVILPVPSMSDNEVYAPNYKDGETVALVRYPHGGIFEIPILTVNNKQANAKKMLGNNPKDAIGINSKVAERLSGADFDGDTVMVIPCNSSKSKVNILSAPQLEGLKDFDPKMSYGGKPEGTFKKMKDTQKQMGVISNLITDMTLKGATNDELARAVRHSMVVIDAEKHNLDYKQSEIDNGIAALKRKYQGHVDENGHYHEGSSTLISRAKSEQSVPKRQGSSKIDPNTGKLIYKEADDLTYVNSKGKTITKTQRSTKMAETDDAFTLVSDVDNNKERLYANYANKMKAMANQARLEILATEDIPYSKAANKTYKKEVDSLKAKLNVSLMNAPKERIAQIKANAEIIEYTKKNKDDNISKSDRKKYSQQALTRARNSVGAKRETIKITDKEWEAIQAGAVTKSNLQSIIKHADMDILKQYATPRTSTELSQAKQSKIAAMQASGYTTSEIAEAVGVSSSTVTKYLN